MLLRPLALLCLIGAFAQPSVRAQPPPRTVAVLVARTDIPAGTVIAGAGKLFKVVRYVAGDEPRHAVTSLAQLEGKVPQRALAEDQPVKNRDVGAPPKAAPMTRAVAVKVQLPLNNFVLPGVRVDVLLVKAKEKSATVLLQNLLVLAIEAKDAETPAKAVVVTLAVTPDQAKQLVGATMRGTLRLVVRAPASR